MQVIIILYLWSLWPACMAPPPVNEPKSSLQSGAAAKSRLISRSKRNLTQLEEEEPGCIDDAGVGSRKEWETEGKFEQKRPYQAAYDGAEASGLGKEVELG